MKRKIPTPLLDIIVGLFSECFFSCIKWEGIISTTFEVRFGVRQGSVLSPVLSAVYIDDLSKLSVPRNGHFIIMYADDVIILTPSITETQKLLHMCERELQ